MLDLSISISFPQIPYFHFVGTQKYVETLATDLYV